jgi:hypothetical protein
VVCSACKGGLVGHRFSPRLLAAWTSMSAKSGGLKDNLWKGPPGKDGC